MREVKVYISRKCRLPSEENHEKKITGLENLQFYFGSQDFLREAKLNKEDLKKKLYLSFQYSEYDENQE